MSKITIVDLEVHYRVGVPEEERANAQRLLLTVDLSLDFRSAVATDRVTKTIDYAEVAQKLLRFGDERSWKLIEKVAADLSDFILSEFQPDAVTVTVKKFPIPEAAHISVSVTRNRAGSGVARRAGWGIP